jgi:hypothetical protein
MYPAKVEAPLLVGIDPIPVGNDGGIGDRFTIQFVTDLAIDHTRTIGSEQSSFN